MIALELGIMVAAMSLVLLIILVITFAFVKIVMRGTNKYGPNLK